MAKKRAKKEGEEREAKKKPRKKSKRREVNLERWIEKYIEKIVELSGLDMLELTKEEYVELLSDLIEMLYGSRTSYTKAEVLVKRMNRYRDRVYPLIAARLLGIKDHLTEAQLEFVVYNIEDAVLAAAPRLYAEVRRYGREDLADVLRYKWMKHWMRKRTQVLPIKCPYCGFHSVMPDMTCLVCGAVISERRLKESMNFKELLEYFLDSLGCEELRTLLNYDYVLANSLGLKHPKERRTPVDVEIYLTRSEKELIRKKLGERCGNEEAKER